MKMHINPIIKKELKIGSRTIKLPIAVAIYAAIISLIAYIILYANAGIAQDVYTAYYSSGTYNYSTLTECFAYLADFQIVIICLIIPILTAGSIAGEREKQTLDIMLTAPISSLQIVVGKLISALVNVLMFVVSSLPALSLCFLYGGIQWSQLFIFIVNAMLIGIFVGAVGLFCSSVFKKTAASIIMTMIIELIFFAGPAIVFLVNYFSKLSTYYIQVNVNPSATLNLGISPLILLLDPACGFGQAVMGGSTSFSIFKYLADTHVAPIVDILQPVWVWVTSAFTLLWSALFIFLAVRKLDSAKRTSRKRKGTIVYGQADQTLPN